MATLRLALGQFDTGWQDPAAALKRTRAIAETAARDGARLVVLPEMATTGWTMDRSHSETLRGSSIQELSQIAKSTDLFLLAGVAVKTEEEGATRYSNSAILFDPSGKIISEYRKQRLFGLAGESVSYQPGARSQRVDVEGVSIAPFICYDLRFPELFRAVAPDTDVIVLIANWPEQRRDHWDLLVRARAVENLCYMVAVNRTGEGGGARYNGGSVAYDPWGRLLISGGDGADSVRVVDVSSECVASIRGEYPFLKDIGA